MISCIICSRQADITAELKENIASTIGCEYELVVIDNSKNEYSIFSAYNEGVRRAKGDILCFMHEDILFYNKGWGTSILSHCYKYSDIGVLGVYGGHYLPKCPCYWLDARIESTVHISKDATTNLFNVVKHNQYAGNGERTFVAAVDGVFMVVPKHMFEHIYWDDKTFNGYHFYDMDLSMQVHKLGYKVEVIWDVLLYHKSSGNFDENYLLARDNWYDKWKESLPMIVGINLTKEQLDVANTIVSTHNALYTSEVQIKNLLNSKAYKIGKVILYPFNKFKNFIRGRSKNL